MIGLFSEREADHTLVSPGPIVIFFENRFESRFVSNRAHLYRLRETMVRPPSHTPISLLLHSSTPHRTIAKCTVSCNALYRRYKLRMMHIDADRTIELAQILVKNILTRK